MFLVEATSSFLVKLILNFIRLFLTLSEVLFCLSFLELGIHSLIKDVYIGHPDDVAILRQDRTE